jgi:hypothetical protein
MEYENALTKMVTKYEKVCGIRIPIGTIDTITVLLTHCREEFDQFVEEFDKRS